MITAKEKQHSAYKTLKEEFGFTNPSQSPRLVKVVISTGVGSLKDKSKVELIQDRLAKITGQKAAARAAKKSISSFKIRQGDIVGYQVTLRGPRMYGFIDKLVNIALPRTKDFRGLSRSSVDEMGNYSLAIKEQVIFPEASGEELKDMFGFTITVVTTASDKKQALAFLTALGFPFKKEEEGKKTKK